MFGKGTTLFRLTCLSARNSFRCGRTAKAVQDFSSIVSRFKQQHTAPPANAIIKNERISYPSMRVVFTNKEGKNEWKIMERGEALAFARACKQDLILVNGKVDPPVCKIELFTQKVAEVKQHVKDQRSAEKNRALKEMFLTGGIERRDFGTKMTKVKEFLSKGHPVKVTIVPKKFLKNHRLAKDGTKKDRMAGFDETILMLLEDLEKLAVTVTEQKVKNQPQQAVTYVNGKKVLPMKKVKTKIKAPTPDGANSDSDSDDSDSEVIERDEAEDSEDEFFDMTEDETKSRGGGNKRMGDSDGEEERDETDGKTGVFFGQKALVRREFLINPKTSMIAGKKDYKPPQ